MNPAIAFTIAGIVAIVWGIVCAVFNDWAARMGKRMQSIYGQRSVDMVTPRYVRFIGIFLAAFGVLFVVLGLTGFFPQQA